MGKPHELRIDLGTHTQPFTIGSVEDAELMANVLVGYEPKLDPAYYAYLRNAIDSIRDYYIARDAAKDGVWDVLFQGAWGSDDIPSWPVGGVA